MLFFFFKKKTTVLLKNLKPLSDSFLIRNIVVSFDVTRPQLPRLLTKVFAMDNGNLAMDNWRFRVSGKNGGRAATADCNRFKQHGMAEKFCKMA